MPTTQCMQLSSLAQTRHLQWALTYAHPLSRRLGDGLLFERRLFHAGFALHDQKEGMAAFLQKRAPEFFNK